VAEYAITVSNEIHVNEINEKRNERW